MFRLTSIAVVVAVVSLGITGPAAQTQTARSAAALMQAAEARATIQGDIAGAQKLAPSATLIGGSGSASYGRTSIGALCPITSMAPVLAITGMVARTHVLRPRWGD